MTLDKKISDLPQVSSAQASDLFILMQGGATFNQTRAQLLAGTISSAQLIAHESDPGAHPAATESTAGFLSASDKTKLDGIAAGAQLNQNAWSSIAVSGQTTVTAASQSATLTLIGSNLALTTDNTGKSVTFSLSTTGVTPGTFGTVTVDTFGRVTGGSVPDVNLSAIAALVSTGLLVRTGSGTAAARSLATGSSSRITISNPDGVAGNPIFDLATSGVTANTYKSVTVDTFGRVTAGTNPTTLVGFGITDGIQNVSASVPSIQADTLANRPAAGTVGRLFVGTDTLVVYRDTGATWNIVHPALTGDVTTTAGNLATTLATVNGSPGTFKSVTVNGKGLVTAGTNPTTLVGFGITDAVKNAGGAPSLAEGSLASRPAAGNVGALYLATDTFTWFHDNSTTWDVVQMALSGDATVALGGNTITLATVNGSPGTFKSVTVNGKGLVTAGTNPTTLVGFGITDAVKNGGGTTSIQEGILASRPAFGNVGALYLATDTSPPLWTYDSGTAWISIATPASITLTGDVTGTGTGTVPTTLATVNGNVGTFPKVTVNAKGLVTAATALSSGDVTTGLGYTPVNQAGDTLTGALNLAYSTNVVAATTTNLASATGDIVDVTISTGTVAITSFGTLAKGAVRRIRFAVTGGTLSITQNSTSMILPTAASITVADKDILTAVSLGSGNWYVSDYLRGTGTALALATSGVTANTYNNVTVDVFGRVTAGSNVAYLTANQTVTLSGDVTGSGATAITATLATVNANVGTFGTTTLIPSITVNGKGLVTAVSTNSGAFLLPANNLSDVSNTTTALNNLNASIVNILNQSNLGGF